MCYLPSLGKVVEGRQQLGAAILHVVRGGGHVVLDAVDQLALRELRDGTGDAGRTVCGRLVHTIV